MLRTSKSSTVKVSSDQITSVIISDMNSKCANQKVFQLSDYTCWIINLYKEGYPINIEGITCNFNKEIMCYDVTLPEEQLRGFINFNQSHSTNEGGKMVVKSSRKSKSRVESELDLLAQSLNRLVIKSSGPESTTWCYFLRDFRFNHNDKNYTLSVNPTYVELIYPKNSEELYGIAHLNDLLCMRTATSYKLFKFLVLYSLPFKKYRRLEFKINTMKEWMNWDIKQSNRDVVNSLNIAVGEINSSCDLSRYFDGKILLAYNKEEKKITFRIKTMAVYNTTTLVKMFKEKNKEYLGSVINIPDDKIRGFIVSYLDRSCKTVEEFCNELDLLFTNYVKNGYKATYDTPFFSPKFFVWDGFIDAILEGKPCKSSYKAQERGFGWRVGDIPNDLSEDMIKMMDSDGFRPDQCDEWAKYNSKDGVVEEEF